MNHFNSEPAAGGVKTSASTTALFTTGLSVLQTVVIAIFGFVLTGRVELALKERDASLKERQATVHSMTEMTALLKAINEAGTDDYQQLQASFAQLAMYGSDAIFPLFVLAANRSKMPPDNAVAGLRLLAVQHSTQVCEVLLNAQRVPKSINEIRKASLKELTTELNCVKGEQKS